MRLLAAFLALLAIHPTASAQSAGWDYVRANPMFVSGLNVQRTFPPGAWRDAYFDQNNTAIHLWATGLNPGELPIWLGSDPSVRYIAWVGEDGTHGGAVATCDGNPGCIGFQLGDEPSGTAELNAMEAGCNAIRAADASALCIANMAGSAPSWLYGNAAEWADILSVDCYALSGCWGARENARTAATAEGIPWFCYLNAQGAQSDMRWSLMVHMAQGCVGITWFLYQLPATGHSAAQGFMTFFDAAGDYSADQTVSWGYAQDLNIRAANLGQAMTQLQVRDARYAAASWFGKPSGIKALNWTFQGPHVDDVTSNGDVLVSWFEDDAGKDYFALVNLRHAGGAGDAGGTNSELVCVQFDGNQPNQIQLLRPAPAYGDIEVRTIGADDEICFTIPAGDIRLWSFNDGLPFVGYP